jgi:transmembrane sensor
LEKAAFFLLLDKYLSCMASLEEQKQLLNFFNSFQHEEDLHKELGDLQDLEDKMLKRLNRALFNKDAW